ncbi:MAG: tRNA (guanosine(46)-N7)-methyltransferase TrmB [Kiritimatiellia bacterium]|jgi:tRNA (guanine-N7-)-methyltransferase|nr:tRNA (guanosine(46)-N7)-methyltransferase TrmB [Kiritimatiellia bacterium]
MLNHTLRIEPQTPDEWLGPVPVCAAFTQPSQPLVVDLGCGKGRFLLAHAAKHPEVNHLGIDRMLRRIRKVDNRARRLTLDNIRLMRIEAYYAVAYLLPTAAVSTYYIYFPDPWPKARHEGYRLFNSLFLDALQRTLVAGGVVHVATDHAPYFEQLSAIFEADSRFVPVEPYIPPEDEQTDFERYYIGEKSIGRLSVRRV